MPTELLHVFGNTEPTDLVRYKAGHFSREKTKLLIEKAWKEIYIMLFLDSGNLKGVP